MLAMVVNDNACCLMARVALASIASMLAPAGGRGQGILSPDLPKWLLLGPSHSGHFQLRSPRRMNSL